jgi:hypothetical protein
MSSKRKLAEGGSSRRGERIMNPQSTEERIAYLEHAVQWRQDMLDQWKKHQKGLWQIVDKQVAEIETLTRQRDAARLELAAMIAAQQMILGHKDFTPEQVLSARGWAITWNKLDNLAALDDGGSDAK